MSEKTMSNEIKKTEKGNTEGMDVLARVVLEGNLDKLNNEELVKYHDAVCRSIGLNPLTKPFEYLTLNGKKVLYAKKDCTEQLRKINGISITKLESKIESGIYIVTAYAQNKEGVIDIATGAVPIDSLQKDARANAIMKAETKAKRRVTLSLSGLGILDESEIETIHAAKPAYNPVIETSKTIELPDNDKMCLYNPWGNGGETGSTIIDIMSCDFPVWIKNKLDSINSPEQMDCMDRFLERESNRKAIIEWTRNITNKKLWIEFHSELAKKRQYYTDLVILEEEQQMVAELEAEAEASFDKERPGDREYIEAIRIRS